MIYLNILHVNNKIKDIILLTIGVCLMSAGVRAIYEPLNLVTGGISGFAIIVRRLGEKLFAADIPVWLTTGLVNVPLFVVGRMVKGRSYIYRSLYGTVLFTVLLYIIPEVNVVQEDYFLAAVIGGVISGAGLGLVLLSASSTGGTDLLGAIIRKYMPHISMAVIIFVIDSVIVMAGAVIFGVRNAAYAVVAVYVTTKVLDAVVTGPNNSKMIMVVTKKDERIAEQIISRINRGVTNVDVKGMYSGEKKKMLICAVSRKQLVKVIRIISDTDPSAFVMITDSREILGEGFVQADYYFN